MAEINDLDVTDANNTARFPENMQFRNVNDSARALEGMLAREHKDGSGTLSSSGSGNAYTVTTNRTISAYYTGMRLSFIANHANTGAATLNVNSLGAKAIVAADGSSLGSGDIIANQHIDVVYSTTRGNFQLVGGRGVSSSADVLARVVKVGSVLPWPTATIPGGWLECDGSAVSRTTYAALFAEIGTTYGAGNGSTTFNLPDYRGYFLRGHDGGAGVDPDRASRTNRGDGTTGDSVGTKQGDQYTAHNHAFSATTGVDSGDHQHTTSVPAGASVAVQAGASYDVPRYTFIGYASSSENSNHTHSVSGTSVSSGGNETRPDNIYVKFIILANPAQAAADTIGVNGLLYKWSAGTSGDPGAGYLGFDNATLSSATAIRISETDAAGAAVGPMLALWDDSTSTTKGTLYIYKVGDLTTFCCFQVTGSLTDNGDYDSMSGTYVADGGTFAENDQLAVLFVASGQKGDTGATGTQGPSGVDAGFPFLFSTNTTTTGDPGTAYVRFNNATLASVTEIAVDDNTASTGNPDVSAYVATWDDSTTTANRGQIMIRNTEAPENWAVFVVADALTDATSHHRVPVAYVASSGSFSADDPISVQFVRTGDKGSDGAGAGDVTAASAFGTDNRVVRSDGTGKGVQATGITVDDSNNVSGVVNHSQTGYSDLTEIGTPSNPSANVARLYAFDDGGTTKVAFRDSAGAETVLGAGGAGGQPAPPQYRLTLSTGVPVMTSSVSAAATLYWTPYNGNVAWVYDGSSSWVAVTPGELSIALSGATASRPHDVFLDYNGGSPALQLTAWTNDTTRATALTTQDGRYVKTGATDHLYLGTIYVDGSNQCNFIYGGSAAGGTAGQLDVWNYYNRVLFASTVEDSTSSYAITGAGSDAWQAANGSSTYRNTIIVGVAENAVQTTNSMLCLSATSGSNGWCGVGLDSSTALADECTTGSTGPTGFILGIIASHNARIAAGRHYLQAIIRKSSTLGTATYYGEDAGSGYVINGLCTRVWA